MIFQLINNKQNLKRGFDHLLCNHINLFEISFNSQVYSQKYSLNLSSNYKIKFLFFKVKIYNI